jgi:hypothetical protein
MEIHNDTLCESEAKGGSSADPTSDTAEKTKQRTSMNRKIDDDDDWVSGF